MGFVGAYRMDLGADRQWLGGYSISSGVYNVCLGFNMLVGNKD